jgi:pimeloyl-ACP methyl ester carboxylesterase
MKKRQITLALALILFAAFLLLRTPDTDPVAMQEKYTNSSSQFVTGPNGLRIHFRDQGNPDGPAIVLIHGTSATLHTWEPLVRKLETHYRLITYTQPGHGLTGANANKDYSFKGMAQALDVLRKHLALDRFILGGNSMGGWVSWRYALANPDAVQALLLLDASGMPLREGETAPPSNPAFQMMRYAPGRFVLRNFTPRPFVKDSLLATVEVKSIVNEAMVDLYWEMMRLPGNREAAAHRVMVDRELHFAERVNEINVPTLLLWGKQDKLVLASAAQTFQERMPNAEAVIYDGVGHLPMEEVPDKVAADIQNFLQKFSLTKNE